MNYCNKEGGGAGRMNYLYYNMWGGGRVVVGRMNYCNKGEGGGGGWPDELL